MKRALVLGCGCIAVLSMACTRDAPPPAASADATGVTTNAASGEPTADAPPVATLVDAVELELHPETCGSIEKLHSFGSLWLASQPSEADLTLVHQRGVRKVINLRKPEEMKDLDEQALAAKIGFEYVNVPFATPEELRDEQIDDVRAMLRNSAEQPTLLHCSSSNRVGAIWLAYRVLDDGLGWDQALAEAKLVGLKAPAYESRIRSYVDAQRK